MQYLNRTLTRTAAAWLCLAPAIIAAQDKPGSGEFRPVLEHLVPGVRFSVVAEQPDVVTPTGIDVDDAGRVWVVSNHTHFRPDDYVGPEHDEVVVLNPDKSRTVYYAKTDATMDLELGPDGWVYLAERDRILRVRDSDGDGVGDVEQTIAVLETEADYPHNGLAGLTWHVDGQLVFSLGENFSKAWTLTGTDGVIIRGTGEGGIFRCSSDGKNLVRTAVGFWNPFGVCVREDGEMFAAENDPGSRPPCRLLHVVDGGDFGYQRRYGGAAFHPFVGWNGELRGTLPMLNSVAEAPCGAVSLGGGLLIGSWSDNRFDYYDLERSGASFRSTRVPLVRAPELFRPTCIAKADDTTFYMADWVWGTYKLHNRGRVWKVEIDPEKADWWKSRTLQPLNEATTLARQLRSGDVSGFATKRLLKLAAGDDAHLADAAVQALSRSDMKWSVDGLPGYSAADRVTLMLARKRLAPEDTKWVQAGLNDSAAAVRFEAIRWLTDRNMEQFADQIERMLTDSEIGFELFEACLAAHNTLRGDPEAGVTDGALLLKTVRSDQTPDEIKAFALRLLGPKQKGLDAGLLRKLLARESEPLVVETIRTIAARGGVEFDDTLSAIASDSQQSATVRTEAVAALALSAKKFESILLNLATDEVHQVRAEALRSLRFSSLQKDIVTELKNAVGAEHEELLAAIVAGGSLKDGRPDVGDTDAWLRSLDSGPQGAADAGRRIFYHSKVALCANCHRHRGRGNVVGPDLTAVASSGDRRRILRAILEPNRDVDPQFHAQTITLSSGKTFTGIMLRKGGRTSREYYRDSVGREQSFPWAEIESRTDLTTSLMPGGLVHTMTIGELRDLLAFLERGRE